LINSLKVASGKSKVSTTAHARRLMGWLAALTLALGVVGCGGQPPAPTPTLGPITDPGGLPQPPTDTPLPTASPTGAPPAGTAVTPTLPATPALLGCETLSRAEAESLLGPLAQAPRDSTHYVEGSGYMVGCVYTGDAAALYVGYGPVGGPGDALAHFQPIEDGFAGNPQVERLDGLGERGLWVGSQQLLLVLTQDYVYQAQVYNTEINTRQMAVEAARFALARGPVAAGSVPATETPVPPFLPCDMLARSQAEAVLGPLTGEPQPSGEIGEDFGTFPACIYSGAQGQVYMVWGPEGGGGQRFYDAVLAERSGQEGVETVAGLGAAALWDANQQVLYALRGDIVVQVWVWSELPDARASAIQLAEIAMVRIPPQ
jgi:hypothetical protein